MTDANEGRPLTRRQLRELERAAELARTGGLPSAPEDEARQRLIDEPVHEGRHSSPSVPAAPADAEPIVAEVARVEAPKASGKFFGRKKQRAEAEPVVEAQQVETPQAEAQQPVELAETVAMDRAELDQAMGLDVIEAEVTSPDEPKASVPAPWSARRSTVQVDDVQGLDTVDDEEIDSLEIDEVIVASPRVSAHRIAEATPAELEDRRKALEADETLPTGPSRASGRLPVIVNVVSDTSEHHIADLRDRGVAGSGGSSTGSFTANALVLPAGTDNPDFQLEGDDGLLVTGSIDVPEGFASSGRGSASIDGGDVDSDIADGEVSTPETAPVRASKAVSSYANARVQIAPQKQRTNMMPVAIGAGAGVFVAGVAGVIIWALTNGVL